MGRYLCGGGGYYRVHHQPSSHRHGLYVCMYVCCLTVVGSRVSSIHSWSDSSLLSFMLIFTLSFTSNPHYKFHLCKYIPLCAYSCSEFFISRFFFLSHRLYFFSFSFFLFLTPPPPLLSFHPLYFIKQPVVFLLVSPSCP